MAHRCERCRIHRHAERHPDGIIARLWRWHTRWCPGWRSYQRALAAATLVDAGGPGRLKPALQLRHPLLECGPHVSSMPPSVGRPRASVWSWPVLVAALLVAAQALTPLLHQVWGHGHDACDHDCAVQVHADHGSCCPSAPAPVGLTVSADHEPVGEAAACTVCQAMQAAGPADVPPAVPRPLFRASAPRVLAPPVVLVVGVRPDIRAAAPRGPPAAA